jgi:hypothetical protein
MDGGGGAVRGWGGVHARERRREAGSITVASVRLASVAHRLPVAVATLSRRDRGGAHGLATGVDHLRMQCGRVDREATADSPTQGHLLPSADALDAFQCRPCHRCGRDTDVGCKSVDAHQHEPDIARDVAIAGATWVKHVLCARSHRGTVSGRLRAEGGRVDKGGGAQGAARAHCAALHSPHPFRARARGGSCLRRPPPKSWACGA